MMARRAVRSDGSSRVREWYSQDCFSRLSGRDYSGKLIVQVLLSLMGRFVELSVKGSKIHTKAKHTWTA